MDCTCTTAALACLLGAFATDWCFRRWEEREAVKRYAQKTHRVAKLINEADERLTWSATRIGKALRDGEFTSLEINLAFMQHLDRLNLYTNAMVGSRFDRAMLEAREADKVLDMHRKNGTSPVSPFLGVPLFSKEVFEMPGMPLSAGVLALSKRFGEKMCFALEKAISEGGVIVLGSGNISEQCMWMESSNHVFGRSNNIYDASRIVGGSSGGTASVVSGLGAPFAITSDVGGSTRIPSLFNGLFGVKPTGGAVSNDGTVPQCANRVNWYCQLGPCTRHSEDLLPLLKIIAGPTPKPNPKYKEFQTKPDLSLKWDSDSVPIASLKIFDCRRQVGTKGPLAMFQKPRDGEMIRAHDNLVKYLRSQGLEVTDADFPDISIGFDIWAAMLGEATKEHPFRMTLAEGKPGAGSAFWAFKELFLWLISFGKLSDHTLPAVALAAIEFLEGFASGKNKRLREKGNKLRSDISNLLGETGVMILPSLPTPAPNHSIAFLLRAAESGAAGLINVLEFPSCAIPLGLDKNGLPVGVQVIANHGNDHLCISVARALEQAGIAGWSPPAMPA